MLWLQVIRDEDNGEKVVERLKLKTSYSGGNIYDYLYYELLPIYRQLAAGKVIGDEYLWMFEGSPIYVEAKDESGAIRLFIKDMDSYIVNPEKLASILNAAEIGLFSIWQLSYCYETRQMSDGMYVCALTRLGVEKWRSPYGATCSRDEALWYYNVCQRKIDMVVRKVIAAKRPNGEPLTKRQKLKYVHDWLITSVAYDYKGLKARRRESLLYSKKYLEYLSNEYGAIVDGKAICEGYSAAFKAIVDELVRRNALDGVECDIAVSDSHTWNRVWMKGEWFNVDVTWDDFGEEDFFEKICSKNFLVSDKKHKIKKYSTYSYLNDPATDRRYEKKKWTNYKKNLRECTVELKYPNKTYVYRKGKKIVPKVIVRYGKNVLPSRAYKVVRADNNRVGTAQTMIIPSKNCTALCGSVIGPSFEIIKAR